MSVVCYLCGSSELESLAALGRGRSVTTDGQILPVAWDKRQCRSCGLLQSVEREAVAATIFSYEENYHFYDRPFMRGFEQGRYEAYADWVADIVGLRADGGKRVLEVGCGAGWVLESLMRKLPGNHYMGIEPSASASAAAREAGINVWTGTADTYPTNERFDVLYSINVVEHTVDPVAFAGALAALAKDGGQIALICPHGGVVDAEMLFVDHFFTFTPGNLRAVFAQAGLQPTAWSAGQGLLAKFQALTTGAVRGRALPPPEREENSSLLARRRQWMKQWNMLDARLCERLEGYEAVLCFGTGEMSDLLRTYAPQTWSRMRGFIIDRPADVTTQPSALHGLPLFYVQDTDLSRWDAVLLGTRLPHQAMLYERLTDLGVRAIRWDDVIPIETDRVF